MGDPLDFLDTAEVAVVLAISLGFVIAWWPLFPRLTNEVARRDIISLQLAWTERRAREVVASWDERGMLSAARRSVVVDQPYIAFYCVTLVAFGVLAARAGGHSDGVAGWLALGAATMGLLDLCENAGLSLMLEQRFSAGVPTATSIAAAIKWLLLGVTVVGSLVAFAT